ncbi:MAG TPA: plastocyanin/azurin family copper-binding protein [Nocardioidaceae bacterium]|nr:plastocyanin/azurin family copper-binding protein [Nocardioidaceae bacterium]
MRSTRAGGVRHALLAVLAVVCAVLVPLGSASASSGRAAADATHTFRVLVGNESPHMALSGMRFLPREVWVDVGDQVRWVANSAEIHTVTFYDGGKPQSTIPVFNPGDSFMNSRHGGHTVLPGKDLNSGIMTTVHTGGDAGPLPPVPLYQHYTVKFVHQGTYTYYCLVHGVMMSGVVHVQSARARYPFSQADYNRQAAGQAQAVIIDAKAMLRKLQRSSSNHLVWTGSNDTQGMVMRFIHRRIHVKVGDTVTFSNARSMGEPHTVTFGAEPQGPAIEQYTPQASYDGGDLSSFIPPGQTFKVTFTKAGTYHYICALHDYMGMVGTVVVE